MEQNWQQLHSLYYTDVFALTVLFLQILDIYKFQYRVTWNIKKNMHLLRQHHLYKGHCKGVNRLQWAKPALRLCVKGWIQWCLSTTVWDKLRWNSSCGVKTTPWALSAESSSSRSSLNSSSAWSEVRRQRYKRDRCQLVNQQDCYDKSGQGNQMMLWKLYEWEMLINYIWSVQYAISSINMKNKHFWVDFVVVNIYLQIWRQ